MSSTLSRRSLVALLALPGLALAKDQDATPRGPKPPKAIEGAGYRLVKDWDFRTAIRDGEAMRREFHTRYIYENGKLDRLKDEWQRYRDNDNHQFTPEGLALTAHAAMAQGGSRALQSIDAVALDGERCGHQRLAQHLPTEHARAADVAADAAKEVVLELLDLQQLDQFLDLGIHGSK